MRLKRGMCNFRLTFVVITGADLFTANTVFMPLAIYEVRQPVYGNSTCMCLIRLQIALCGAYFCKIDTIINAFAIYLC